MSSATVLGTSGYVQKCKCREKGGIHSDLWEVISLPSYLNRLDLLNSKQNTKEKARNAKVGNSEERIQIIFSFFPGIKTRKPLECKTTNPDLNSIINNCCIRIIE